MRSISTGRGPSFPLGRPAFLLLALLVLAFAGAGRALPVAASVTGTTTSVSPGAATITNQTYNVGWTVSPTPTDGGNITVTVAGTNICTVSAAAGSGNCGVSFAGGISAGSKNVSASYAGSTLFGSSNSSTLSHTVNKASPTLTITDTHSPSVIGQAYEVDWSFTAPSGLSPNGPSGNVTVSDGTSSCNASVATGKCNLPGPAAFIATITATYPGDGNYNSATSPSVTHSIGRGDTTTTVTSVGSATSVVGEPVTVNYSVGVVSPATGTPTGTVTASAGNSCLASVSAGNCAITWTTAGAKSITAKYAGDAGYNPSTSSPPVAHTVNQADTTILISNSAELANSSQVGQPYLVKWAVSVQSPGAGTPTGYVMVMVNDFFACFGAVGDLQCSITPNAAGTFQLKAQYFGDNDFKASITATAVPHTTVLRLATKTTITNTAALGTATAVGTSYVVQWTVAPLAGTGSPTGVVTITGDGTCSGAAPSGQCTLTSATPGGKSLVASYGGDVDYDVSTSATVSHAVNPAVTVITVTNAASLASTPTAVNTPYTVQFSVTQSPPGSGTPSPTGTVFMLGSDACYAGVTVGQCTVTPNRTGVRTMILLYLGDSNFQGALSALFTHTVQ